MPWLTDEDLARPAQDATITCAASAQNAEHFFPKGRGQRTAGVRAAARTCGSCASRVPCLLWALDHDVRYGVWGGLNTAGRETADLRLRRRQALADRQDSPALDTTGQAAA